MDCGELVVDVRPEMRGILVGVSFSRRELFTEETVEFGICEACTAACDGPATGPTEGEPAMVGRCCRELRREASEALLR